MRIAEIDKRRCRSHDDAMSSALGEGAAIDVYDTGAAVQVVEEFEQQIAEEGAYTERGWLVNSGEFDGMDFQQAFDALAARFEAGRPRPAPRQLPPARLGRQPPALLGLPDPGDPVRRSAATCRCPKSSCRWCCRRTWRSAA